ncbi:pimeloyl-ACP methyl ester carboxylesterase [Lachnotalea glycerini]|uniref:Pimeloyl-ACP methyl ester carboxylesterase n=1 Tax=Lachnotalea glycerini TaxID=1763509 RepID=A0A318ERD5_9FIRM|nr:alpha/beta hydrolase [Lachnotalea glycerini]PXV90281.1 pimeloyl-ACP methyl ester carboxylesterase [Lachnotalea glycerini]
MNINIDHIKINYIMEGEGETILMLHGWGSNILPFQPLIKHLSSYYKVYALDMPGFGQSNEPSAAWTVDDYVEFIIKFVQEMKITSAILIGHSFGGECIIKLASHKTLPFQINKIILMGSAGIRRPKTLKQKFKICTYKCGKWFLKRKLIQFLYPDALENFQSKSGSADYRAASPLMRQSFVKVVNEILDESYFTNIKPSTLLIWGENDTATPLIDGQYMEKTIPDAGLVTIKNAGHYVFLDQAFTVHKVIDSFLNIKE